MDDSLIFAVLFLFPISHFVGDFLLQSDWMALNKSKWNQSLDGFNALGIHCLVYAACFLWVGWVFAGITLFAHLITDAITSKITTKLWLAEKRHWFFVMIGFDQLIHFYTLVGTLLWLEH